MPFVILPTNSASGGYEVTNSLRFNSASSDYLSRTPSSTGDRQKFTISCWVKRSTLTASGKNIMVAWSGAKSGASFGSAIYFNSSDQIEVDHDIAGSDYTFNTNMVFRDVSAWYHIVLAVDTTQATSANRQTIYVNGSSVTLATSALGFPIQNFNTYFNFSGGENDIGSDYFSAGYADQYMSEFYLIDGQALTPSSFGETDTDTGIWKPKAYTGTYGTNGFYLQFKNSASLGTDSSGNGNTFTVNNLTSIDQTTDTPTNNFATLNPLAKSNGTLTEGNTLWSPSGNDASAWSTIPVNKGKWYFEMTKGTSGDAFISISQTPKLNGFQTDNDAVSISLYMYYTSGGTTTNRFQYNGSPTAFPSGFGDDDNGTIYGLTLDFDADQIIVRRNNDDTTKATFSIPSALKAEPLFVGYSVSFTWPSAQFYWNFGNPSYTIVSGNADANGYGNFEYAVPSGFYALCTKNLATFG